MLGGLPDFWTINSMYTLWIFLQAPWPELWLQVLEQLPTFGKQQRLRWLPPTTPGLANWRQVETPRESGGLYTPTALPFHQNFNGTKSQRTLPSCEKLQLRILIGFCWGPLSRSCWTASQSLAINQEFQQKNTIYWLKFRCLIKVHTASCNLSSRIDIYIYIYNIIFCIYIYIRIYIYIFIYLFTDMSYFSNWQLVI